METPATIVGVGEIPESLRGFGGLPVAHGALAKVRYTHDAMIDLVISDPWISQDKIAAHFGYTPGWISQVFTSDVFQARLAERKSELVDPAIRATIEENIKALAFQSMAVLRKKLEAAPTDDLALGVANIAIKALGYGAKQAPTIQQQFVIQAPGKAPSSEAWITEHTPILAGGQVVEIAPRGIRQSGGAGTSEAAPVSRESVKSPAPSLPDPEKLLAELVSS